MIPGKRMKSQGLKEETEVEAVNVAEEDLEEVEEVATTEEQEAMVVLQEEISATTAKVSVILQESALSRKKKDLQETSTTMKIVAPTREEGTMKVEISTTEIMGEVVLQKAAQEVGATSKMREREAHGTKRKTKETSGEVKGPTLVDRAKMHLKEQQVAGEEERRHKEARTLIHKIILLVVGETIECLLFRNSYFSNA